MKRDSALCLPAGLPDRFANPETGFTRLCEFLNIATRSDQQWFVNNEFVKRALRPGKPSLRNLPTSERLRERIMVFYCLPAERRDLWRRILKADPDNVPSLEYRALKNYDPEFLERELDETSLGEFFSDFPGFDDAISELPAWRRPALTVWPDLRSDLLQWETLSPSRRDAVTLATFAVATVLDDVRFLEWATGQAETLTREYAFALNRNFDDAETTSEPRENLDESAEAEINELVKKWNDTCRVVADTSSTLVGDPPRPEHLDGLIEQVRVLEGLHGPLLEMLDALRPEKCLERVALFVSELASHDGMSWLGEYVSKIRAQWQLCYVAHGDVNIEQLRQDVERVERELKHTTSEWREIEHNIQRCQQQLQDLEASAHGPGDLLSVDDRKVELQEEAAEAARKRRDARRRIFQGIAPHGQEFDPSKDYENACNDPDVLTELVHGGSGQESVEDPDRESNEEVLEATPPVPETKSVHKANEAPLSATDDDWQPVVSSDGSSVAGENEVAEGSTSEASDTDIEPPVQDPSPVVETSSEPYRRNTANAVSVIWQALDAGRPGIAYHIAKLLAGRGEDEQIIPPADLIAASALANHLQSSEGEVVSALRPFLERINPDRLLRNDRPDRDAINLLLFSAALRPALFAPATGATSLLRRVSAPEGLTPVYELAKVVADSGDRLQGIQLNATLLTTTLRGNWQDEFGMFTARVGDWRNRAESKSNLFHRARLVWTDLLSSNGVLGELIALITRDDTANSARVEAIRKQIGEQRAFNDLVQKTDRGTRKGDPIQGRALKQLWDHVQPAINLSKEWLHLMEARPDPKGFVAKQMEALRDDILLHGADAIAAIDKVLELEKEASPTFVATLKQARHTIDALLQIFDDGSPPPEMVVASPVVIQSRDLLYVTGLDLDTEFRPTDRHTAADMLDLLLDISTHAETLSGAFKARISRGDLIGAQLACKAIDAESSEAERCRTSLDQEAERQRLELKKAYDVEEGRLERAFCRGQLDINERDDLSARLVSLKRLVQSVSSLDVVGAVSARSELVHIQQTLERSTATRLNEAKNRFKTVMSANPEANGLSIIEQEIELGDILTANEYMSRLEEGDSVNLPAATDDPFQEFRSVVREIDQAIEELKGSRSQIIVRRASARERIAGVDFGNLSEEEAGHAASLLEAWYKLARAQRDDRGALRELLEQLGFKVRDISTDPGRGWSQARLTAETIEDRAICPSRQFGSEARGRYRVLLVWKPPAYESIAASPGIKAGDPTVVLYFGCLGSERERLRAQAIQTHRLFLIVDESLILFLAARPSGQLSALFRSALPFTSVNPYATTSSLVPPELFYGRGREQREITDPSGACFIYGGRQLGKTAILRRVETDFNRSGETNRAKWIDLKVNEIGHARGPRDIWPLLQRELGSLGVIPKQNRELDSGNQRQVDSLLERIRRWIDERENRRLLLLLDEADAFLEQDARTEFRESAKLKGLMDKTDRRFKVVFAGLHNVLRTIRQANHPLAHFGDPIRVGAMLANGEWRHAQALIQEPLQAAGCLFERDELSTRILAQTNYFPSLIQLYGTEIVRRLRDSTKTFPYMIRDEDINAVYSSQELGSAIRERFLLTLQLDQRYEVIAYAFAYELTQASHGETALGQGLDHDTIAAAAREWWSEGFKMTDVEFGMLLHEMEGLGVLRSRDQGRRYTLRNPNILTLLGNSDDIEKVLLKKRELPMDYDPAFFRARYPQDRSSSKRRGPLTYRQESALRSKGGVAIISGCKAAGLENVSEFLQQQVGPDLFRTLRSVSDPGEFEQELKTLLDEFEQELKTLTSGHRDTVTICLVPLIANWNASWVTAVERVLKNKFKVRIVFTATPEKLWQMMAGESDLKLKAMDWIGPWDKRFLRHWLEDINFTADADHVKDLMDVSGGWPVALDAFGEKPPRKKWSTRLDELDSELLRDRKLQDFGIYSEEVQQVLFKLLEWADNAMFHSDSIECVADDLKLDTAAVSRRVKWSECLGLVACTGEGCWTFNPLIRRLLEASDPA